MYLARGRGEISQVTCRGMRAFPKRLDLGVLSLWMAALNCGTTIATKTLLLVAS
jgi:hypothetical protein